MTAMLFAAIFSLLLVNILYGAMIFTLVRRRQWTMHLPLDVEKAMCVRMCLHHITCILSVSVLGKIPLQLVEKEHYDRGETGNDDVKMAEKIRCD